MIEKLSGDFLTKLTELEQQVGPKAEDAANTVVRRLEASGALGNKGALSPAQHKELMELLDRVNRFEERVDH